MGIAYLFKGIIKSLRALLQLWLEPLRKPVSITSTGFERCEVMAQPGRQAIISSNLWVLEYLLEQDKVEDELIKHFYDGFLCDVGELPPPIQVRLMLRVLRDNVANITQSSLDALNCLTNFSHESPDLYPPACRVEDLSPPLDLYVQVLSLATLQSKQSASSFSPALPA